MGSKVRIAITTGDNDGIGPEVVTKALQKLGPIKDVQFILFRSRDIAPLHLKRLKTGFKVLSVNSLAEGLWTKNKANLIDVANDDSPAKWVELCANLAMTKQIDAIATGPLSKVTIVKSGMTDLGHTEIFARVTGKKSLFMGFVGSRFCVLLATGHLPLSQVSQTLTPSLVRSAVEAAEVLKSYLPKSISKRPVALLGLNPHAGESGLLGNQEVWFRSLAAELGAHRVVGPLVPDAAFLRENWRRFSVYVCPYHDQGLIPFKMAHGFSEGVHITLGLPFVRTSVDHGTAMNLVGKNTAKYGSMQKAIEMAVRLAKEKTK